MDKKIKNRLIDMRNYSAEAIEFLGDLTYEEFLQDRKTMFSVVRAIEVIGEAAAQTGREPLEVFPGIPWKEIIGMRNILIHQYSGIEMQTVYKTVKDFLPGFMVNLDKILEQ